MGIDIFMITLLVIVLVIIFVYRLLWEKKRIVRFLKNIPQEPEEEKIYDETASDEARVDLRMETVHAKTLAEVYQDCEVQVALHEKNLCLMSFDRKTAYSEKELKGRVIDYAVIINHDTYSDLACTILLVCQTSPHEYLYEKYAVLKVLGFNSLKLERQLSIETEMAKIAHVFYDAKGNFESVALTGKEGLDMEFISFNGSCSDTIEFDGRIMADGCSSSDYSFYTYDGSLITRLRYCIDGTLEVLEEVECIGDIRKAFFKHTRETAGISEKPLLYDGSNIIFPDTYGKIALEGVQSNAGNVFFSTDSVLWFANQGLKPLKIMDQPMIPLLFLNQYQDKSSFTCIFKTASENQAFAFDFTEGSLSKVGICKTNSRILDAAYNNSDGTLYIFAASETYVVRNFLDLGFEVVISAKPSSEAPIEQVGLMQ